MFVFDPSTSIGRVRVLIGDFDPAYEILSDQIIQTFIDIENGIVKLAAAQAMDMIASSQALIFKVSKVGDVQVDGVQVAAALRAGAQALRDSLANEVAFDFAEVATGPFNWREIIIKDAFRNCP